MLLIFSLIAGLNAQQLSPMATGLQKYRQGDLEGAVIDLENALSQDKENERIKSYLFNCYLALGVKYTEEGNYPKAISNLESAQKINPEDKEVKDLYESVKAKMAPSPPKPVAPPTPAPKPVIPPPPAKEVTPPAPQPTVPPSLVPVVPPPSTEVTPPPVPVIPLPLIPTPAPVSPPPVREVVPPAPKVEKAKEVQPKKVSKPAIVEVKPAPSQMVEVRKDEFEEKLKLMLARIDRDRQEILRYVEQMEERERKERQQIFVQSQKAVQKTILIVGIGLMFLTFFILGPIYSNVRRTARVRDKMFHEYEERINRMIEEHKESLSSFVSTQLQQVTQLEAERKSEKIPTSPSITPPEEIIEGVTPELRLHAIGIIENELGEENQTERIVAMRLLEPFLNDKNKKVQMRAAKSLSKYAPEKSANFLRDAIKRKAREISPELIRTFTEDLPPIGSAEILISFLNHPDLQVKREVLRGLEHLVQTKSEKLPPAVIANIQQIIQKVGGV